MLNEKLDISLDNIEDWRKCCNFSELLGHTVVDVFKTDTVIQIQTKTHLFHLYHEQDCCESVYIESIVGDLESLIGQEILLAECVSEASERTDWGTSTWTFYKLASIKGYIDVRFLGESNGYYSEGVSCQKVELPRNENVVLETKYFKVLESGGDK